MADDTVWRGHAVKILELHARERDATIITPCGIPLRVRQAELAAANRRKKNLRDSRKF